MIAWLRRWRRWHQAAPIYPIYARPTLEVLEDRYLLTVGFVQTNLVSDLPGMARVIDPYLVNPWGISYGPTGAFWLGENGTGVSDLLDGTGQQLPLVVSIPGAGGSSGRVTGVVFNDGPGFQVSQNGVSGPGRFLFATEDGILSAWNPKVDNTHAVVAADSAAAGTSYKGLALGTDAGGQTLLYAANFGRGSIDVFDSSFHQVLSDSAFRDPTLPDGYAPFNVANINGLLFVTYAQKEADGIDDVAGAGHGFIDVYTLDGSLVERFASGGPLNSPWGMALAPADFGPFGGDLLVGNEGDGRINAFDPASGAFLGTLTDQTNTPIAIDHLWGLTFGNDHLAGSSHVLFFAAGIDGEQHGLFGAIQPGSRTLVSIAGSLPYDPTADDDGYPLPPSTGPALQDGSGPVSPSSLLLPVTGSAVALAPTLVAGSTADPHASLPASSTSTAGIGGPSEVMLASLLPSAAPPGNSLAAMAPAPSAGTIANASATMPTSLLVTGLTASSTVSASLGSGAAADASSSPAETGSSDVVIPMASEQPLAADPSHGPGVPQLNPAEKGPAERPVAVLTSEVITAETSRALPKIGHQPIPLAESDSEVMQAAAPPSSIPSDGLFSLRQARGLPLVGSVAMLLGALGWWRFRRYGRQVLPSLAAAANQRGGRSC